MKLLNIIAALSLVLFVGCGGGSKNNNSQNSNESMNSSESQQKEMSDNVRTINVIGIDKMKFVVKKKQNGITVGNKIGKKNYYLLKSITAHPGEKIKINLTTESKLPASAMSHNWLLLKQDADVAAFAKAGISAKDNAYVPPSKQDEVVAETGLVAPGNTKSATFTVPQKTGQHEFICTFPGHYTSGMKGKFIIKKSDNM